MPCCIVKSQFLYVWVCLVSHPVCRRYWYFCYMRCILPSFSFSVAPLIFKSHSPGLKCHRSHHADKHDIEDGVGELHSAFYCQDQHARHRLHSNHCGRTCKEKQPLQTQIQICQVTRQAFLYSPLSELSVKGVLNLHKTLPDEKSY